MVSARARGFTLIEVMISVAILGIVASMVSTLFLQLNRFYLLNTARTDLQQEARPIMYVITRSLREAENSTIVIDRYNSSQPFCSRITFTKIEGTTLSFYQDGNELIQLTNSKDSIVLTKDLEYVAFAFPSSATMTLVSIAMTLTHSTYQGQSNVLHMASQDVQVMN